MKAVRKNSKRRKLWSRRTQKKRIGKMLSLVMERRCRTKLRRREIKKRYGMRPRNLSKRARNSYMIALPTKCFIEPKSNGLAYQLMYYSEIESVAIIKVGSLSMSIN